MIRSRSHSQSCEHSPENIHTLTEEDAEPAIDPLSIRHKEVFPNENKLSKEDSEGNLKFVARVHRARHTKSNSLLEESKGDTRKLPLNHLGDLERLR